jgi:hypothetical protein
MSQLTKYGTGDPSAISDGSEYDHWFYDQMVALHEAAKRIIAEHLRSLKSK